MTDSSTLDAAALRSLGGRIERVADRLGGAFPGERPERQPVHTFYGGAHLFTADVHRRLGRLALEALGSFAPDPATLAAALALPGDGALAERVYERVVDKLEREPVEDYRIDFEDGYGNRPDDEEDGHARSTAGALGGSEPSSRPPFIGIRVKPLSGELHRRSLRTLDLFVTTLVETAGVEGMPRPFLVTLPKVLDPEQVAVAAEAVGLLERALGLQRGAIGLEVMVETTQAVIAPDGRAGLRALVDAGDGRVLGAHFGTYDYTAACQITAAHQAMDHPACDFARHVQQVSLAGTGVWLSDGGTNVLPVPVHRGGGDGDRLGAAELDENRRAVHGAWRLHADHIRHSLIHGYYQGWDLHPAQLPSRYAAVYAFFLESLEPAAARLRTFVDSAARATLVGEVFDDAATGQGLLNFFLRAVNCGAVTEAEVANRTGLSPDDLRSRSFLAILAARR